MSKLGIIVVILGVLCVGSMFLFVFAKKGLRLPAGIFLAALYLGFMACLYRWGEVIYEGGNLALARATFTVGGLVLGTIILAPIVWKSKIATWIDMSAFLLLSIAFVILAVYLSKTVFQPEAPLAYARTYLRV